MPRYELLNNVTHKDLRIVTRFGREYGDEVGLVPAFPTEFAELQREYPIFLRKDSKSGDWQAVALLARRLKIVEGVIAIKRAYNSPTGFEQEHRIAVNARFTKYASDGGRDFNEYLMPGPGDLPEMEVVVLERPAADGPDGAKGPGEMCATPQIPAIATTQSSSTLPRTSAMPYSLM